ncbi:MAG: Phospholipase C [Nitrospira sp.]|jgi:phospholipase C|nr:Phospholipase C [Nitrospira sp.]
MAWTGRNWGLDQPRFVTDLTGDGRADIVGFGSDGVWTALGTDGWAVAPAHRVLAGFFGYEQGWRTGRHLRLIADLTGKGKADLVGFGEAGVLTALSKGDGTFVNPKFFEGFGVKQGWHVDQHPRFAVDLTGDGKADIIGFGGEFVWVALNNGDGTFQAPKPVLDDLVYSKSWRVDQHPRFVVDLTDDGKADIIGFGGEFVWVALNNGDGTFKKPEPVLDDLVYGKGWRVDQHPRFVVDLTGDGKADIIGFGGEFVWVALNNGDGTFKKPEPVLDDLVYSKGWRVDQHPRFVVDLTGDGKADLVGFGDEGVWSVVSNGDGTFGDRKFLPVTFSVKQGWRVDQHLRLLADLTGDGKADLVGFGNDDGPWVALSNGDGTFQPARLVHADIGDHPVGNYSGTVVQSITIDFHTHDDGGLDIDSKLHMFVKNRRGDSSDSDGPSTYTSNLQAYRDHDADWFSRNPYLGYALNASQGQLIEENSTHRVTIQLRSQPIPVEELELLAMHIHIIVNGNDRCRFDYTLTLTLNDGTVLSPFSSNVNGLTGIILDQDNRNYYGICSEVRPSPPRTRPSTDAVLTDVIIEFHTHNDDKDADTNLGIHIVNRLNETASQDIVVANGVAAGQKFPDSDEIVTPIDERYTRIDLPLASNAIFLRDMVLPVVFINIAPNGNDRWIFDYRVTFVFGKEQPYSWTVSGVVLDQDHHKHMGVYNGRPFPTLYSPRPTLTSLPLVPRTKAISMAFLQQKLDELLNRRQTIGSPDPLIKLKLDSAERFGKETPLSYMDLQFITNDPPPPDGASLDQRYSMGVTYSHSLLELLQLRYRYYGFVGLKFDDINSQFLSLNVKRGDDPTPLILHLQFETDGPQEVTGTDSMNVINFEITLRFTLRFDQDAGAVDLLGWVRDLNTPELFAPVRNTKPQLYKVRGTFLGQALDDVTIDPHDYQITRVDPVAHVVFTTDFKLDFGGTIQKEMRGAIFDRLSEKNHITQVTPRESINAQFSSWLMGGVIAIGNPELVPYPNPCRLLDASVNDDVLTLNYHGPEQSFVYQTPSDWPAILEPGALANIDHIVVLMQENRSFDHMLGYLSLPYELGGMNRKDVDGLKGGELNTLNGRIIPSFRLAAGDTIFSPGPPNDAAHAAVQINGGKMHGFVQAQADVFGPATAHRVMGYHTADNVPTYDALARDFAVGHRWFASHPGPTFPNRFYAFTGRPNIDAWGAWEYENPSPLRPVFTDTIFDHLTDRGVSWTLFEHYYSFLRFFERHTFDSEHIVSFTDPVKGFAALAKSGTLPSVSFIEPHYMDYPPGSFCDEAPSDIRNSQKFIRDLVETVVSSPKWDKTLLIITYDEHGGFYDHVPPRPAVKVSEEMLDTTGVRVPCFVISPWVKGGTVFGSDALHFDHTSILKTIARRFLSTNPPYMGARYAAAHDLSEVLERQIRPGPFRPFLPYTLVCSASNMGLDVQSSSVSIGAPLCQLAPNATNPNPAQDFRFEDAGDGLFYLRTFAGLYVTVDAPTGAPAGAGGTLTLKQDRKYEPGSGASRHPDLQKWKFMSSTIVATKPDEYTISCAAVPGKVLQPEQGSTASGASVVLGDPEVTHSPVVIPNPWTVTSRLLPSGGLLHT